MHRSMLSEQGLQNQTRNDDTDNQTNKHSTTANTEHRQALYFVDPFHEDVPLLPGNMDRNDSTDRQVVQDINDGDSVEHHFFDGLFEGNIPIDETPNEVEDQKIITSARASHQYPIPISNFHAQAFTSRDDVLDASHEKYNPHIQPKEIHLPSLPEPAPYADAYVADNRGLGPKPISISIDMATKFHQSTANDGEPYRLENPIPPSRDITTAVAGLKSSNDDDESYEHDDDDDDDDDSSYASKKDGPVSVKSSETTASKKRKRTRKKYEPERRKYFEVTDKDVLCHRGGQANKHPGNKRYHKVKEGLQELYAAKSKEEKGQVAEQLVQAVQKWGGRFLEQEEGTGRWFEIHKKKACIKASQALRERYTKEQRAAKRAKYNLNKRTTPTRTQKTADV